MTKGTALLVLGAILLVVMTLVGDGGTMARIAGMDQDRIEGAVDEIGMKATESAGLSATAAEEGAIVRPTVVGEAEPPAEFEPDYEADNQAEVEADTVADETDAIPYEIDTTGFDPRTG